MNNYASLIMGTVLLAAGFVTILLYMWRKEKNLIHRRNEERKLRQSARPPSMAQNAQPWLVSPSSGNRRG